MRRKDREITDPAQIQDILAGAKILHLGLFDTQYLYVVPLHYGYQYDGTEIIFYIHGAAQGKKVDLIRKNPNVCVEVDCNVELLPSEKPCNYSSAYASVIGTGTATVLENIDEKIEGLKMLMLHQTTKDFEISEQMAAHVTVVKINIKAFSAKANMQRRLSK